MSAGRVAAAPGTGDDAAVGAGLHVVAPANVASYGFPVPGLDPRDGEDMDP